MLTPRLRRFALLVLGFSAFLALTVLTPTRIWAGTMFIVYCALMLWLCWHIAKDPWPWGRTHRRSP